MLRWSLSIALACVITGPAAAQRVSQPAVRGSDGVGRSVGVSVAVGDGCSLGVRSLVGAGGSVGVG